MKLTIKTLSQSTFKIDIELDKTVKELKERIEKDHGKEYSCGSQKLIYNGKILADENKLDEYNIDEKKFIVLMITRPPPVVKAATSQSSTSSSVKKEDLSSASAATTGSKPKDDKLKSSTNAASSTRSSTSNTSISTATPTPASQNSSSTTTLSANATTDRAAVTSRTTNSSSSSSSAMNDIFSMSEPQVASRLAELMTDPNFRQMQDVIQQTPQLLSSRIEELSTTNPDLYRFISENPDAFVNMLNHPPVRSSSRNLLPTSRDPASVVDDEQSSGQARDQRHSPATDQTFLVGVSEQDKEAIERLKELGFSEYLAIQAYIACEKDEQLAANLLFQMDQ